jgi:hypothetical protein
LAFYNEVLKRVKYLWLNWCKIREIILSSPIESEKRDENKMESAFLQKKKLIPKLQKIPNCPQIESFHKIIMCKKFFIFVYNLNET